MDSRPVPPRQWKLVIVAAAALALIVKLLLALNTYGTNDVYAWERFALWSQLFGSRLYSIDPAFNHPPSMIHVLGAMTWLAKTTGIFFPFWLRLPSILADAGSLWIAYRMFAPRFGEAVVRWTLLLFAISPTLILVSGFHGNTDSVVMFFILLSVRLTGDDSRDWAAGAAFGAAMCVKIFPVIVLPVLFFCRRGLRRRAIFVGSAAAVIVAGWSPWLFRDPAAIFHQVIGYQSIYGHWGFSWLAAHLTFFRDSWHDALQQYSAYAVLAVIAAAAFAVNRRSTPPPVYSQVGAALFFFLTVSNGFGVQYLAWLVPWTVAVAIVPVAFFTAASGIFLFVVYHWWSGGFPWYLADSNYVGDFSGHLDYFLTVCWLSVAVLAWAVWKRPGWPSRRNGLAFSVLVTLGLILPAWRQVMYTDARTYPAANDRAALNTVYAGEHALLSEQYYRMGRYTDAVVAARTGVALDPGLVETWNTLAQACIRLKRWDEASNAAGNAIRLAPNDAAAVANLEALRGQSGE